jgi:hypothetical protein
MIRRLVEQIIRRESSVFGFKVNRMLLHSFKLVGEA